MVEGKYAEADRILKETLIMKEDKWGKTNSSTLKTKATMAESFQQQGRVEEALILFREVLDSADLALGKDHPDTALFQRLFDACLEAAQSKTR